MQYEKHKRRYDEVNDNGRTEKNGITLIINKCNGQRARFLAIANFNCNNNKK